MPRPYEKNIRTSLAIKKDESPASQPAQISEAELAERIERLRAMGRTVGKDFAMKVEIGKEPGWKYKFKPINTIEVDPNDVRKKGLDYCFGIITHEGAHRRISRMDFIPTKQWQESGFAFLMNAVEDPRVNNWISGKYEGAANWLQQVYNEDLHLEGKIDQKAKKKLGYTPKHIQYGLEVIRYWHTGKFSDDVPNEVKGVLEETIKNAEKAYNILPTKEPEEEEITQQATQMYEEVRQKIWPEYKKLVDKAWDDETLRQVIKEMMENGDIPPQAGELLPLDEMSEEMREKIKKQLEDKLEGMTEEERDKIIAAAEKKAGELLDELESDLTKVIKGKFSDQPETKTDEKKRKARVKVETELDQHIKKDLENAKKKIEKKAEKKDDYQRAYEEVKPYIDKVAGDLMNIFIAKRFPQFKRGFPGQKLRLKGAMKFAGQRDYSELFERRQLTERPDYSFLLLVDLSGSMKGEKIEETFKGTVLFTEALSKVGETLGTVDVATYGFQDVLIPYKNFDERLDDSIRIKMNIMKKEVSNEGQHNHKRYNNDGYCLDKAAESLKKQKSQHQIIVVLSDGKPEGDGKHRVERYAELNQDDELRRVVEDISHSGEQYVLGIGLGPETGHVANFYRDDLPNVANIPNVNVQKLCEVLSQKIEELVK